MARIGRHLLAMAGIFVLSFFAGTLPGPSDPASMLFFTCIMFPVALIAYLIGIWIAPAHGEKQSRQKITITLMAAGLMIVVFIIGTVELYRIAGLRSGRPVESIEQPEQPN